MTQPFDHLPDACFKEMEAILESLAKIQVLIALLQQTPEGSALASEAIAVLSSNVASTEKVIQQLNRGLSRLLQTQQRAHSIPTEPSTDINNTEIH